MKSFLLHVRKSFEQVNQKLADIHFFRKVGITYQVLWNLLLVALIVGFLLVLLAGGTAAGYFASLVHDEQPYSEEELRTHVGSLTETSEIYLANDVYLGKIRSDVERDIVTLDDIADEVKWAIVATEDEHFYEHEGIVPKALLRATMQEIANSSVQTGGSTLTQQLIKQQVLSNEVSFDRKATEIMLAMRLEHFMSKDEILEAYLNVVPFGRNASGRNVEGIQAASMGIFGVAASELNLAQSAYLAGMPQSPFGYTPFTGDADVKDEDGLRPGFNRFRTVLNRMYESGYIDQEQRDEALDYDLAADFIEYAPDPMARHPRLTSEILERATEALLAVEKESFEGWDQLSASAQSLEEEEMRGTVQNRIENGGYKITTTIDEDLYSAMNDAASNSDYYFGPNNGNGDPEEVGAVLIDNRTGAILSFVGGREENLDNQLNYTTRLRSPGSTIKPILPFAGALEAGVTQPGLVIPDTPTNRRVDGVPINNYDNSHDGNITLRESLKRSRNVPAIKAWWHVPEELKQHLILSSGVTNMSTVETAAIGGGGATVEQIVSAYSAFANDGKRPEAYMIEKIETYDGEIVYEHEKKEFDYISPQSNYLLVDMMRDVVSTSGGTASRVPGLLNFSADWAGKTGTSNENIDSWFVASNPYVSLGVWNGYTGSKQVPLLERYNGMGTGERTQNIWANIANAAYSVKPSLMTAEGTRFQRPSGLTERRVCGLTGGSSNAICDEEGLVTTDLYNNNLLSRIDGLSPFQSELKSTVQKQLDELRKRERDERRENDNDDDDEDDDSSSDDGEEENDSSNEDEDNENEDDDDTDEGTTDEEEDSADDEEE
ncbi:transglycosylase domain-containing protein [Shouchella miscanthi]|uniref:Transglycosylase domain-containing protein n=1 Tax=Shouchella miscanthi TaxID=2598861 RepID=A0ABU6NRB5_9BACI|nr:transglycosylase domain-containing protein [Shouchella miscanthi]